MLVVPNGPAARPNSTRNTLIGMNQSGLFAAKIRLRML